MSFEWHHPNYYKKQKQKQKINPNYKPGIDPPSYRKDTHLKPGEPNPKDQGVDGYEYHEDILEDYKPMKNAKPEDF
jgi:hypothetical protein